MTALKIKPIRTESDYERALARVDRLMDAKPGHARDDELEVLVTLIEAYEDKHHRIDPPDPIDAIMHRMEALGLARKDLEPVMGSRGRISEVLSRRRGLSLAMIRGLHEKLGISLEALMQPYETRATKDRPRRSVPSLTIPSSSSKPRSAGTRRKKSA
jgi:HTH-type transcriptional regulator/antitoxin HigA